MKAIIFGASGQDGYYLSALLKQQNYEVIGVSRQGDFLKNDISDYNLVAELVNQYKPEFVFHLAANSTTTHAAMFENHATIATGTLNILEAVKNSSPSTKVFIAGSGLQFKNDGKPIKETDPFEARDAYSVSRIQSVYAARYFRTIGIKVYVGYFFNHDSPMRIERHMTKKIAEGAKRIAVGSIEKIVIGDIKAVKEYTYAGDIVKGIWTLVNQPENFEANISSGKGYSIKQWLEECFLIINKNWEDYVTTDPEFIPACKQLISDPSRIFSLGWKPEMDFRELAQLMMK
ncbi:MAG: GDP-mannose 4,6-dehydratase [Chitinophagaceae bacterium]|nr:GDP-mannose 4,6-dehydratase [Chitinophagaceae bacterium]